MRAAMPDLAIRTTFIVGYPGETDEPSFRRCSISWTSCSLTAWARSHTRSSRAPRSPTLGDPVPEEVKEERRERLMELQQRISLAKNQAQVGRTLEVLVEGHGRRPDAWPQLTATRPRLMAW